MCHKRETCPNFERRTINGVPGGCVNCEYIKRIEKTSFMCRIGLVIAIVAFVCTTWVIY